MQPNPPPLPPSAVPLSHWLSSPQGRYVLRWAEQACGRAVSDVFGFHALQLGWNGINFLAENRIPHHGQLGAERPVGVQCALSDLPIASQSVDLVVLPFALELADEPHQVLREIERILRPEGQLVILAFNPWSLWGLRRLGQRFLTRCFGRHLSFPWRGEFYAIPKLRDWLQLLGFEVERGGFGCYAPPCESDKLLRRLAFLEKAGDRWWCFGGGTYVLRAIKRVGGVRLISPWKRAHKPRPALAAPVTGRLQPSPTPPHVLNKDSHDRYTG